MASSAVGTHAQWTHLVLQSAIVPIDLSLLSTRSINRRKDYDNLHTSKARALHQVHIRGIIFIGGTVLGAALLV